MSRRFTVTVVPTKYADGFLYLVHYWLYWNSGWSSGNVRADDNVGVVLEDLSSLLLLLLRSGVLPHRAIPRWLRPKRTAAAIYTESRQRFACSSCAKHVGCVIVPNLLACQVCTVLTIFTEIRTEGMRATFASYLSSALWLRDEHAVS